MNVEIIRDGVRLEAEASDGELLSEVLARAGVSALSPCGGRGVCGKCRVRASGALSPADEEEKRLLAARDLAAGWRLACRARVAGDVRVFVPVDAQGAQILTATSVSREPLLPSARLVRVLPRRATLQEQLPDDERTLEALPAGAQFTLPALRALPAALKAGGGQAYLSLFEEDGRTVIDCASAEPPGSLGVAVDIGTTTMAAYLLDLETGDVLADASCLNPQRTRGADVISRVDYACTDIAAEEMRALVCDAMDGLIERMLAGRSRDELRHILCVGNTVMMHLLLRLPAAGIAVAPFIPVSTRRMTLPARALGLRCPNARLTAGPGIAGYVGADTVAAMLDCDMDLSEGLSLLMDIGTNGEIALGGPGGILCCSAAAGPAFEGAHIRCGNGAVQGAVAHARFAGGNIALEVIGGGAPRSICGSGLADAIAGMLDEGIVDETGRLDEDEVPDAYSDRLFSEGAVRAFSLDGRAGEGVFITQRDVRELQLAKAAIAAGVDVLLAAAGATCEDIRQVYLAGGFGNYIGVRSAARIGLIPEQLTARVRQVGNAAGGGALRMLRNRDALRRAEALRGCARYIELSSHPDFQSLFVEKMAFGEC